MCLARYDATPSSLGVDSLAYAFSVLGADGADIGTITQSGRSNDSYEIALAGRVAGRVRGTSHLERIRDGRPFTRSMTLSEAARGTYDHLTGRAWHVEDEPGHSVAKITYIASQLTRVVTYVVQLGPRYAIPFGDNFEEILIGPSRKEEYVPR
jgi:hypothetical protein